MIRKLSTLILAAIVIVSLVLVGCVEPAPSPTPTPAPSPEETIELSCSLFVPQMHLRYQNVVKPWIAMVEEKTNGKVHITTYFANALAPTPENYDAVRTGIADMGEVLIHATPGRFPVTEILTLPGLGADSPTATDALMHLYETFPECRAEYPDVHVITLFSSTIGRLHIVDKPVYTLEDARGLKIRGTGAVQAAAIRALGMAPVTLGMADVYLALQKGEVEGATIPYDVLTSRKWAEPLNYSVGNIDFGRDMFGFIFNEDSWNALPADVQEVIDEMSGRWLADFYAREYEEFTAEAKITCDTEYGIEIHDLPPQELARWSQPMKPIWDEYAQSLNAKGLPGTEMLEETVRYIAGQ